MPDAVTVGDRSVPFLQQAALRATDALPAPRVVRIAGADHMMPVENPADLSRAIRDVLH